MTYIYVYWDDSNVFISAKDVAVEREGEETRFRVRIHFANLVKLALADRKVKSVRAAGSIPRRLAQDGAGGGVGTALRPHWGRWGAASPRHDAAVSHAK